MTRQKKKNAFLTVLVSAEVRFGMRARIRLSCLVDRDDPELVPLALAQAGHAGLQLVDGGLAVLVVRDQGVEPSSELVLLLDDVVGDGAAAVVLGLVPP